MTRSTPVPRKRLDPQFLHAIGTIAIRSAALDYGMEWLIWVLVGRDHSVGAAITRKVAWARKLDLFKSLVPARIHDPALRARLEDWGRRANDAQQRRNKTVHRAWLETPDAPEDTFTQFTYSLTTEAVAKHQRTVTLGELQRTARDLWRCFREAQALMGDVASEVEGGKTMVEPTVASRRRQEAARKYKPDRVKLLLVADSPPKALDRYFYFEDVAEYDALFRYVVRGVLGREPTRGNKRELLAALQDAGVWLIDLRPDPEDDRSDAQLVPDLVRRVQDLAPAPDKVILIKASVYDAAYPDLVKAGLPVVNERIPFPGSGRQAQFVEGFRRALGKVSWGTREATKEPSPRSIPAAAEQGAPTGAMTQPITAVDKSNGRIRLPRAAKRLFPDTRTMLEVVVGGQRVQARYDPRLGPDKERSGVLGVGRDILQAVEPGTQLRISAGPDGVLRLT